MHIVVFVCPIFIWSPHYFPVDPETPIDQGYDYVVDDPSFSAELPGKQPSLIIPISPIPFSLIHALDVAVVTILSLAPILMHSLLL